ncbi:MAG: tyrosine-type recombinase/integrase [Bacilli bacterium]
MVLYRFGLALGLRLGELLGLKWSRIDFDKGTVTVDTSARREKDVNTGISYLILTSLKTESSYDTLYMPPFLISDLKSHKLLQDIEKTKASNLYNDSDLVFSTELGKIIEPTNLRKRYNKLLNKANISHKTIHALRHTCATRLMEAGLNLRHYQKNNRPILDKKYPFNLSMV